MPQAVKISTNVISGSIKQRNVSFNIEGAGRDFGTLDGGNWYSNVLPDDGRWIIISESKGSGKPAFWLTAGSANSDLLTTVNGLPTRYNQTDFTDTGSALYYLVTNNYMVLRAVPDQSDADGFVLDYDASNVSSYPRTGTVWYDLTGFDYDGALLAGPGFDDSGYIVFDGVDDRVTNTGAGLMNVLGADFTIEMLIKPTNINSTWQRYITVDGFPNQKIYIENNGSNPGVIAIDLGGNAFSSNGSLRDDEWFHIVGTNNGSSNLLYLNGEYNAASAAPSYAVKGSTLSIGAEPGGGSGFIGGISKTRIYNKALSATEIKQNYFGGPIVTDGLYYNIDASNLVSYDSGTTTYSLTGSGVGNLINGVGNSYSNGRTWVFDGTDDLITTGEYSGRNPATNPFTVEAWVRSNVTSGAKMWLDATSNGSNQRFYASLIDSTTPSIGIQATGWADSTPGDTEWHYQAIVMDGSNALAYNNGQFMFQVAYTSYTLAGPLNVGGRNSYIWDGDIANFRIYDRALTAEEIGQNYNAQKQKFQK
jgi:hypothetical protein